MSDRLIALLERQRELVERLADLAARQLALIDAGETDQLLDVLGRRQTIVDEFVGSQDELGRLTVHLEDDLNRAAPTARQRIRSLVDEIGRGLESVMRRDCQDQEALAGACRRTKVELASLGSARAAAGAYRASPGSINRFADRQG